MGKPLSAPIQSVFITTMHQFTYSFHNLCRSLYISSHCPAEWRYNRVKLWFMDARSSITFFWSPNRIVLTEWASVSKTASDRGWNRTEIANSRTKPTILIVEGRIWALDESLRMNMAISPKKNNTFGGCLSHTLELSLSLPQLLT